MDFDTVRRLGLALPGVEEYTCYGTPALRVKKTLLARLREDGETLVVKVEDWRRELLMQTEPETYFTEPHYHGYPLVLIRLPRVSEQALAQRLEQGWRMVAPKRLLDAWEQQRR